MSSNNHRFSLVTGRCVYDADPEPVLEKESSIVMKRNARAEVIGRIQLWRKHDGDPVYEAFSKFQAYSEKHPTEFTFSTYQCAKIYVELCARVSNAETRVDVAA